MATGKQVVVAVAFGSFAERLDRTFISFAQNPFLELHAFILGDRLPDKQLPQIHYHLRAPDPSFSNPLRDAVYRRWQFIDELDAEYAVVVDNNDVLCLQVMPELPVLLRGAAFGACVEHLGGRYIPGQGYTSSYINCGVTFWHIPSSRDIRRDTIARGRRHFRNIDDQRSINEVAQTLYYDQMILLPCQYNYRANVSPLGKTSWLRVRLSEMRQPGWLRGHLPWFNQGTWPVVTDLDGVVIYHNSHCIETAKRLLPVKPRARLPELPLDPGPLTPRQQFWRRVYNRIPPHIVGRRFR